jgi:hypothetical protein
VYIYRRKKGGEKRRDEREVMGERTGTVGKAWQDRTVSSRVGRRIEQRRVEQREAGQSSGRDRVVSSVCQSDSITSMALLLAGCQSLSVSPRSCCLSSPRRRSSAGIGVRARAMMDPMRRVRMGWGG